MIFAGTRAGDIGVQCLDFVGEPGLDQKIESAVGDRGLCAQTSGCQLRQYIIGPQRTVLCQQDFERTPPNWRETQTGRCAMRFGAGQGAFYTRRVIVVLETDRVRHQCFSV